MKGLFKKTSVVATAMIAVTVAALLFSPLVAAAEEPTPQLYRKFGLERQPAHYVIAVDTSLSMKDRFEEVTPALKTLTGLTRAGDRVSVVSFDRKARLLWSGRLVGGRKRLNALLPEHSNRYGTSTDIGAAMEVILARLRRSPEELQIVFFITDGLDEPPSTSKYAADAEPAWQRLTAKGKTLKGKLVKAYGIGLDSSHTDVALMRRVFPTASHVTLRSSRLSSYFSGLKEELRRQRLLAALRTVLASGKIRYHGATAAAATDKNGKARGYVTVSSTYRKVDVIVKEPTFTISKHSVAGGMEATSVKATVPSVRVPPGGSVRVPIIIAFRRAAGDFKVGSRRVEQNLPVLVRARVVVQPSNEISSLGLDSRARVPRDSLVVKAETSEGTPYTYLAAAALAAILLGVVVTKAAIIPGARLARRYLGPPPLRGRLTFLESPTEQGLPRPVALEGKGNKVTLGSAGDVKLADAENEATAELFTKWAGGTSVLALRKLTGPVRVREARFQPARLVLDEIDLKKGTIIEIGGYKVQWL